MGSDPDDEYSDDDEYPSNVDLDGYWIMRTEVTNEQYGRCVEHSYL